ncbi:M15 family metallopeptidase domain-containing protein [Pedobacter nanyangensis]|uniref:M15 family metallopeptidase n=1 Tax=Pedobacter nanyangensis TaxID=1562389 RepID=UPI0013B3757D|nr:M15 family metallopeptidase [Pedobacter nanyangensis]
MNQFFSYQVSNDVEDVDPHFSSFHQGDSYNISEEIIPLVNKLITLCQEHGFFIKILSRSTVIRKSLMNDLAFDFIAAYETTKDSLSLSYHNFGLAFGVGIYECSALGQLKYLDHEVLYDKVGKLGESLGFTWASKHQSLRHLRYFELKPHWAKGLNDRDMMNELYRRKQANVSLLASAENN